MTWTVEDTALMLQAIAGYDAQDPASSLVPVPDYSAALRTSVKGLVIGVPRDYAFDTDRGVDPETVAAVEKALGDLEELGARVEEVQVPSLEYAGIATTVMMLSEAFSFHRDNLASQPQNFGELVRDRFYLGALFTAADYVQAQRARSRLKREFAQVLERVDVVVTPTSARPASTFKEVDPLGALDRPSFTGPFNQTGLPAISIPCGFNQAGLPIGLQIAGRPFDEPTVLRVAYAYQQQAGWYLTRPPA
jgi:aspartyl-tRNA(Asn)/glutamyl-tRNA(Gln) amidotransferase subunit A